MSSVLLGVGQVVDLLLACGAGWGMCRDGGAGFGVGYGAGQACATGGMDAEGVGGA